jgi:hypothetical protein
MNNPQTPPEETSERNDGHTSGAKFCFDRFLEKLGELSNTDPEKAAAPAREALKRMRDGR